MNPHALEILLNNVKNSNCSVEDALEKLANFPAQALPDACVDNQRHIRTGIPEVIYGGAKTVEQIIHIASAMLESKSPILATRVEPQKAKAVMNSIPELAYQETAQLLIGNPSDIIETNYGGTTLVICAGTSDIPVAEEAYQSLLAFGHPAKKLYDAGVAGLHRLLDKQSLLHTAATIIVAAGMEGALPSVVAGLVSCPVIAVPTSVGYGASFGGIAALLGMLNSCAPGVAVVNIDNGFGAACMAEAINRRRLE